MSYRNDAETVVKYVDNLKAAGAALAQTSPDGPPPEDMGIFAENFPAWEAGKTYARGAIFEYQGNAGYVKQDGVLAQEHQPPFSTGTESIYGARPAPDRDGIYPYVYNMSAKAGMRVRNQGVVYRCTSDCPDMLWPPFELAAHFEAEG